MSGPPRIPIAMRMKRNSKQVGSCSVWQGTTAGRGYPNMGRGGHRAGMMYAHRAAWELTNGPIPEGMEIHHKCENKKCINPKHMELVTPAEHYARHRKPYCSAGHRFTPDNTFYRADNGARGCIECRRLYMQRYYLKRKP